jgi:ABC-type antimicrobial peptide transport system permease subunit
MAPLRARFAARWALAAALTAESVATIRSRSLQATLSAAGIATGIGAVVLLVSVVSGLQRFALENIMSAGGNVIQVSASPDAAIRGGTNLPAVLRAGDERLVLAASNHFDMASAENTALTGIRAGQHLLQNTEVRGVTAEGLAILHLTPRLGRRFLTEELEYGSRVALIGAQAARHLFGSASPLGQTVEIGPWPFVIVGVLNWVGEPDSRLRSGLDDTVFVPFRTAAAAFHGDDAASNLRLRLRQTDSEAAAAADAVAILDRERQRRGETGGNLRVANTVEQMRLYRRVVTGLEVLVAVVGGMGLFVGGIGVANALLTSVRERTVEIGVRRAFGATRGTVFTSFLFEAVAITIPGGLIGLLTAFCITRVVILLPFVPVSARPHVSLLTSAVALTLLVAVGVVAGLAPARRAARVYPADALRAD